MDDRSVGDLHVEAALDYAERFDNAVGFEVNPDKT